MKIFFLTFHNHRKCKIPQRMLNDVSCITLGIWTLKRFSFGGKRKDVKVRLFCIFLSWKVWYGGMWPLESYYLKSTLVQYQSWQAVCIWTSGYTSLSLSSQLLKWESRHGCLGMLWKWNKIMDVKCLVWKFSSECPPRHPPISPWLTQSPELTVFGSSRKTGMWSVLLSAKIPVLGWNLTHIIFVIIILILLIKK